MKAWHVLVAVAGLGLAGPVAYVYGTRGEVLGYVTKSERDQGHKYVYLDAPPGMLYNDDSWLAFKRNSGTIHGQIPDKTSCVFEVYGWRIPMFSMAPNILSAKCERS